MTSTTMMSAGITAPMDQTDSHPSSNPPSIGEETNIAASSSITDDEVIKIQRRSLRQHPGLASEPGNPPPPHPPKVEPSFFIKTTPDSIRGAKCKLSTCREFITPGKLRVVVNPSMDYGGWHQWSAGMHPLPGSYTFFFIWTADLIR